MATERLRASDTEREEVAALVRTAMADGRLTLAEGEERLAKLYEARFRDELGAFVADLPGDPASHSDRGYGPSGWPRATPAGSDGPTGQRRWANRRPFRRFCPAVIIAAALVVAAILSGNFFWAIIPLAIIGIILSGRGHRRGGWGPHGPRHGWAHDQRHDSGHDQRHHSGHDGDEGGWRSERREHAGPV